MYIVFEGVVGSGKSTQAKLLADYLEYLFPNREVIITREPGGSEIAEAIRTIVQATQFAEQMDSVCTAYLYAASRAQTLRHIVKPNLIEGKIVIADRSIVSSLAIQGYALGVGLQRVLRINAEAVGELWPDLVIYLHLPLEQCLARIYDSGGDKYETYGADFHSKVSEGYMLASQLPVLQSRWVTINACGTADEVFIRVKEAVLNHIRKADN